MEFRKNVLAIVNHGLGDLLMSLPMIRSIDKNLEANDNLFILVRSNLEAEIINTLTWTCKVKVFSHFSKNKLFSYIKSFQLSVLFRKLGINVVVAPMLSDKKVNVIWIKLIGANFSILPIGKWLNKIGDINIPNDQKLHKVEFFAKFSEAFGFKTEISSNLKIELPKESLTRAKKDIPFSNPTQKIIILAPGSGEIEAHKRWPAGHYQSLIKLLLKYSIDLKIIVFGSQSEKELIESIIKGQDKRNCIGYIGENFFQSLSLLSISHIMVSGCSGASHMAAAASLPTVGLYGPTNPGWTGAYNPRLCVTRIGLLCSPCYRHDFITGCGNPVCMLEISPEKVFEQILKTLNGEELQSVKWYQTTTATKPSKLV